MKFLTAQNKKLLLVHYVQYQIAEMECLAKHGILLPPNMQGLTDEQITDLKLKDEWADRSSYTLCNSIISI